MFKTLATGLFCTALLTMVSPANAAYDPDRPSVQLTIDKYPMLVDKYIARRNFDEALALIDEGLQMNPKSVQLRFQRCVLFEKKGDLETAAGLFAEFIGTYPEIPEPYNNLAAICSKTGNLEKAEELLEKALQLRPTFAMAHANLGNLYLAKAKLSYERALRLTPGNRTVRANLQSINAIIGETNSNTAK